MRERNDAGRGRHEHGRTAGPDADKRQVFSRMKSTGGWEERAYKGPAENNPAGSGAFRADALMLSLPS